MLCVIETMYVYELSNWLDHNGVFYKELEYGIVFKATDTQWIVEFWGNEPFTIREAKADEYVYINFMG